MRTIVKLLIAAVIVSALSVQVKEVTAKVEGYKNNTGLNIASN